MQVGNTLLLSKEFQSLSAGAQMLYLCACMESGGRRQFTLPARALKKYGISERSGRRHIAELVEKGFLTCTCSGRITRTDSQYEFSLSWKLL